LRQAFFEPQIVGGKPFAHHTSIFSNASADAPYHRLFLVTLLFHVINDLTGSIVECKRNIW